MINLEETIIAQYANSPVLLQLIQNMNSYIDPTANLDNFYNLVRNVETATGYGLDVWGRIVGVGRLLKVRPPIYNLGFSGSTGCQPFGQAPFYSGPPTSQVYTLSDTAFRRLIYVKALSNISGSSIKAINQMLTNLYGAEGRAYAQNPGNMHLVYVFEFLLSAVDLSILLESGALSTPAGVSLYLISVDIPTTFGFAGSGMQPFNQGSFCNGITYVA